MGQMDAYLALERIKYIESMQRGNVSANCQYDVPVFFQLRMPHQRYVNAEAVLGTSQKNLADVQEQEDTARRHFAIRCRRGIDLEFFNVFRKPLETYRGTNGELRRTIRKCKREACIHIYVYPRR